MTCTVATRNAYALMCLDLLVKYGGEATPSQFAAEDLRICGGVWEAIDALRHADMVERRSASNDVRYCLTERGRIAWAIWSVQRNRRRAFLVPRPHHVPFRATWSGGRWRDDGDILKGNGCGDTRERTAGL